MKFKLTAIWVGAALLLSFPATADACNRSVSKKAAETVVPAGRINQSILDDAIRVEVNYHRCRAGLRRLNDAGNGLANQAKKHSVWMARTQQLTHRSTVAGLATLQQRVKKAGVIFRTGSENIGMVHRYQIDNQRFRIVDRSSCQFCLLYTSPSPRDQRGSRMPSSA